MLDWVASFVSSLFLGPLLLGGALGALLVYLALKAKAAGAGSNAAALTKSAEAIEKELRSRILELTAKIDQLNGQLRESEAKLASATTKNEADAANFNQMLAARQEFFDAEVKRLEDIRKSAIEEMKTAFKSISAETVQSSTPQFVTIVEQTFAKFQETSKGDLAARQEAIQGLVKPLAEQLNAYQHRLQQSESIQQSTIGEIKQQLVSLVSSNQVLAKETEQFRMVLNSNQARGKWGEQTLRRVVEAAGMSAHCDFIEQTGEGDGRPDMIVKLPADREIIVDAKVPDLDAIASANLVDSESRRVVLSEYAKTLRGTIRALADRNYPKENERSLDYVVMFLPAESIFAAALEGDRDLVVWAAEKGVMIATPTTLIGLLRTIAIGWDHYMREANSQAIIREAIALLDRVKVFFGHVVKMRDQFESVQTSINKAIGSFQQSVLPSARRLEKATQIDEKNRLPEIELIDVEKKMLTDEAARLVEIQSQTRLNDPGT